MIATRPTTARGCGPLIFIEAPLDKPERSEQHNSLHARGQERTRHEREWEILCLHLISVYALNMKENNLKYISNFYFKTN